MAFMKVRCSVILVGVSVWLISCAGRSTRTSAPPGPAGPAFEQDFLQNRIAHQQAALEMAAACVQKAVHPELKQFCTRLNGAEAEESKQLQDWLKQWYGPSTAPAARERATQGYRNFLQSVQSSTGSEFEQAFLSALRLHGQEGPFREFCTLRASQPLISIHSVR